MVVRRQALYLAVPVAGRFPGIIGLAPGDPFDPRTWSGASRNLFGALDRHGALVGAVDASVPPIVDLLAKAQAFAPQRRRWRERYEYSPVARAAAGRLAARRASVLSDGSGVALQVGAWHDAAARLVPPAALRCSFHDSNLALFSRQATFVADREAPHIRRTLAAERRVFDRMDLIFTMSEWLRRSMVHDCDQDPGKVVVTGSGANLQSVPAEPPLHDAATKRVLFVGFDFVGKGGEDILAAFEIVRARHPTAELRVVGPEPRTDSSPGVRWIGRVPRAECGEGRFKAILREANVLVIASRYDAFPNAILEAMAFGLPCVGTNACGIPEMIVDGVSGRLVGAGNVAALASALNGILSDPQMARRMGEAGHRRIVERFTWDRVTARMVEEIQRRLDEMDG